MAQLTVQKLNLGLSSTTGTYSGITPSYAAANTGGDTFLNNDGRTFFHVKNGSGSPITVTIANLRFCNEGHDHDVVLSVPATTGDKMIGPFNPNDFSDGNGLVTVTYSAVTSLTVAAISLAEQGRP